MEIQAIHLYKSLKMLAPIPKTFEVEEILIQRDLSTGKSKKKSEVTRHAVICISIDSLSAAVDFDCLKGLCKKLGKQTISITIDKHGAGLLFSYIGADGSLANLPAVPSANLDLSTVTQNGNDVAI